MNFLDFKYKFKEMEHDIQKKGFNLTDVKIGYTKATGDNIIVALSTDTNVVAYFKW